MFEICSQLTIKTLERQHIIYIDIFNIKQLSRVILVLKLLTLDMQFVAGTNDIINKASQNKSFLPFNFAITKICVVIHLEEDGTRMGGI